MTAVEGSLKGAQGGTGRLTWLAIGFGSFVIVTGIVVTLLLGYKPQPARVMKPSFFSSPAEIAAAVMKRFYVPLTDQPVLVLGVSSEQSWAPELIAGFVQAGANDKRAFATVAIDRRMPDPIQAELFKSTQSLGGTLQSIEANLSEPSELLALIDQADSEARLLIVVPDLYASHEIEGNMINRLESRLQKELFSISAGPLALARSEESKLSPICIGSERDGAGTSGLGCLYAQASRYTYRKRLLETEPKTTERFTATMISPKPKDVALLVRPPGK